MSAQLSILSAFDASHRQPWKCIHIPKSFDLRSSLQSLAFR